MLYTLSSAPIDYIALPPCIRHACMMSCVFAPITILVSAFRRVYSFATAKVFFLLLIARSATRPLRSSFSFRHRPFSVTTTLIYFLRIKFSYAGQINFSKFSTRHNDARKTNNIRCNLEMSTHINNKNTCSSTTFTQYFTNFFAVRQQQLGIH